MTAHYTDKGYLLIRNSDIKDGRFEFGENPIFLEKSFALKNSSRMHQLGDVITVHTGDVGTSAVITENEVNSVGFATIITRPDTKILTSDYLCSFLNTDKHKKWAIGVSTGDGRTNYNLGDYYNCIVPLPEIKEQEKISCFIKELNNIITLHQCEYFLYFENLTDSWEQRKLSEIADIVGGGTPSTQIEEYWDGDIDWYAPAEMLGQNYVNGSVRKITQLGLQKSSAKILPAHKTILFTSRAGIGKMAILQRNGATNQGFQSLVLKDNYHPYFIYSMGSKIKDKAESIASGSTFLEISGKMLGNVDIFCPLDKEQKSIGILFENFDNLITLHQRKCEKLKNIKKSLLEKMFV